jgi:hypothetical protein
MSNGLTVTVRVPSRRTLLVVVLMGLLAGGVWWAATAWAAGPPSTAGVATVAAGSSSVVVPKATVGIDLTQASKVQATAMTASSVGVRSVVPSTTGDTLTIRLTGTAPTSIRVAWSVSNGSTPADSAEVAALAAQVAALQSAVTTLQTQNGAQQSQIEALQTTLTGVSFVPTFQGQPTIRFSGVNVQVVDGQDQTSDGATNGRGNLMIGWNENSGGNIRSGSHNLVIGPSHSYTSYGGLVAGYANTISGPSASVSGGLGNIAAANWASVSGGADNLASATAASVSGGQLNRATGAWDSVAGGDAVTCNSGTQRVVCGEGSLASPE